MGKNKGAGSRAKAPRASANPKTSLEDEPKFVELSDVEDEQLDVDVIMEEKKSTCR